jgi:hypothetical protein
MKNADFPTDLDVEHDDGRIWRATSAEPSRLSGFMTPRIARRRHLQ